MKVQQQKTRSRQNKQDDVLGSMLRDYYLEGCRLTTIPASRVMFSGQSET